MDTKKWLFWNVDTQVDFVYPEGKLYVNGADDLKSIWEKLTNLAKNCGIRVVNSADFHYSNSEEFDSAPDFKKTFPQHCIANTKGAEFIDETNPDEPVIFEWNKEYLITPEIFENDENRNFIIRKDAFDVFQGNKYSDAILNYLNPEIVVVYGVTTNVCVDAAVKGLVKRKKKVWVIKDAIKELPDIPFPYDNWEKLGVLLVNYNKLKRYYKEMLC